MVCSFVSSLIQCNTFIANPGYLRITTGAAVFVQREDPFSTCRLCPFFDTG
jgi:hypothetical protein